MENDDESSEDASFTMEGLLRAYGMQVQDAYKKLERPSKQQLLYEVINLNPDMHGELLGYCFESLENRMEDISASDQADMIANVASLMTKWNSRVTDTDSPPTAEHFLFSDHGLPTHLDTNAPLYQRIANFILNRIIDGTFTPEEPLPGENDLMAYLATNDLAASRGTYIKAMEVLAKNNVITRRQGEGSFVNPDYREILNTKGFR